MAIVRFALRFPHTFFVLAALILFLGVTAIRTMPADIFPEIDIDKISSINGMDITFVTSAPTDKEAKSLLAELGLPFKKN